jgi:hypothetical protein
MSFIITTVSAETVVQVSDTRLTSLKNQSVLSETLRKTLVVQGSKAHFVVGWAGFAADESHQHRTGDWLFKRLFEMNAVELPIEDIAFRLEALATADFANLRAADKRCVFEMAGWQESEPFLCTVSNYCTVFNSISPDAAEESRSRRHHIPSVSEAKIATPKFSGTIQRFRNLTERDYVVNVTGDFKPEKLEAHFRGLEGLLKQHAAASQIGSACRRVALQAAVHSKTIGRNLIGVEMSRTGKTLCTFYSEDGAGEILVPPILSPEGCSTETSISTIFSGDEVKVKLRGKIAKT